MIELIEKICRKELGETPNSIVEIKGFGTVNRVFDVQTRKNNFIFRINDDLGKILEYEKEKYCIDQVSALNIPSPKVLKIGQTTERVYMVQTKLNGINGQICADNEKKEIWGKLGGYASKFQRIKQIGRDRSLGKEFHKNWESKLSYNLSQLNENDSLIVKGKMTAQEQTKAKKWMCELKGKKYKIGLVNGDLCPRNVIYRRGEVYLIDWGTAEIDIVPHSEIGILMMNKECNKEEFECFLRGMGIKGSGFEGIEEEIKIINLLNRLDKYRWAEDHNIKNIESYEKRIIKALDELG